MKKMTLIAVSVSALIAATANPLLAQDGKDKPPGKTAEGGHSHFTKIPATVPEIWAEIHKQQVKLAATVEKKDLGEAHDHAFAIRDLVKALPEKIAAENKAKAEAGAKEIAKIASDIDKTAAGRAQKATEANVKKLSAAITALEAKLKPRELK
jgi:hypothetical protein